MWPSRRLVELFGIEVPLLQAPMAGASGSAMAVAVGQSGALGSLPCAMLSTDGVRQEIEAIRAATDAPLNLNFFCHSQGAADADREAAWLQALAPYYQEFGLELPAAESRPGRAPFDQAMCEVVEEYRPQVVSFHFGLPAAELLARVRASGAKVISSATTVAEARWLAEQGCDAIIAQGYEAGGHRGIFLHDRINSQPGTMALVPQVVNAVDVPVIAAGGIVDARGIAAAFALGACGVQMGTAFLFTPQALISDLHRAALLTTDDDSTVLTNVFSGRPARGIVNRLVREVGPIGDSTPAFPGAGAALAPLKKHAEQHGSSDFSSLWSGQAAALGREMDAGELVAKLVQDTRVLLAALGNSQS